MEKDIRSKRTVQTKTVYSYENVGAIGQPVAKEITEVDEIFAYADEELDQLQKEHNERVAKRGAKARDKGGAA